MIIGNRLVAHIEASYIIVPRGWGSLSCLARCQIAVLDLYLRERYYSIMYKFNKSFTFLLYERVMHQCSLFDLMVPRP